MKVEEHQDVPRVEPLAPWIGGKRNLAKRLVALIETIPHSGYAEPFLGMGGVFLRRRKAPRVEVINDLHQELITLFRMVQRHPDALAEAMRLQLASRAEFERLLASPAHTLTDLERAVRFLFVQRMGFGGKVIGRSFGVESGRPARFIPAQVILRLRAVHARLAGVVIECLPYSQMIARYDRPGMLFYIDPPYWGTEGYYGRGRFAKADFAALADQLRGLKGQFIMSINDHEEVRRVFAGFEMEEVQTTYTAAKSTPRRAGELVIRSVR